ncbi:hypothetical protein [Haladaptatus sp. NG-SE-30]
MTRWTVHVGSAIAVAVVAIVFGHHPIVVLPLVIGALLPEVDAVNERTHRSWLFHTFLAPAIAYQFVIRSGIGLSPLLVDGIHFVTIGMVVHFVADYVYPRTQTHPGAEWPVRPTVLSAPWGLLWLGLAWFIQWFGYLSNAFLPWLVPS